MAHILSTLLPVFLVIAMGYGLTRYRFLSAVFLKELNRLVYYISLPALMLHHLARAEKLPPGTLQTWLVYAAGSCLLLLIGWGVARALGLRRHQLGTFLQAAFRGNLGFIGIPILTYALRDQDPLILTAILAQAVFVFAPTMVFYNVVSVLLLVGSRQSSLRENLPQALREIATNPLIIAAIAGLILFALPFDLPIPLTNTLDFVGATAGPMALVCVGGAMARVSLQGRYRSALASSLLKVAALPALIWLLARPFGFTDASLLILMVFAATPTAVASYVMAREMGGDEAMASGSIVLSTLLSALSLAVVVGLFG